AALDRFQSHVLAARPQTLRMLVRVYRKDGTLPPSRFDLYEQATRALCEESNPKYRDGRKQLLSLDQRVAVAGRLAAVTVLAGRRGFWTGPESLCPAGFVPVTEV